MNERARHSAIGVELLDDPDADPALVERSLHHLQRANRWFGGVRTAVVGLRRLLDAPGELSLLDIGTGRGDIPLAAAARLAETGVRIKSFGLERHPRAAALATADGVPTVIGDGFALPFGARTFDVVLLSQVAHHFSRDGIRALAREASRVARRGVVLADLRRSRIAQVAFALASRVLGFDPVTRRDGVTSLARGFRADELRAILGNADIEAEVTTHWAARILATWRVDDVHA